MGHYSRQVNGQPLENLKGVLYLYKSDLRFSYYMPIGESKLQKRNARSIG